MESHLISFRTNATPEDIENVRNIIVSTDFFYEFEVPVAVELVEAGVFEGDQSGYFFIFAEVDGRTVAYSCYGHIAGTDAKDRMGLPHVLSGAPHMKALLIGAMRPVQNADGTVAEDGNRRKNSQKNAAEGEDEPAAPRRRHQHGE